MVSNVQRAMCSAWTLVLLACRASGGGDDRQPPIADERPAFDPGRKDMHRLNTAEYNATVQDVLGTKLQPATANWRGGELAGFDNMAAVLSVDEEQYDRYLSSAKALAADFIGSESLRARFFDCTLAETSCARASIEAAGLRLFRRPLRPDELETYASVYTQALELGDEPLAALELAFQALLASAEFIYRIELDPQPSSALPHPLSSFELASRLSYFLWSSAPDEELLRIAADGSLSQPTTLSNAVDRMLHDAKAERLVSHFAGQWLGARNVVSHAAAPELYAWSPFVARAAGDEIDRYFAEFLQNDRSWFEFLLADVNYVTEPLARFYGIPTPSQAVERVEHLTDQRAGFFGLAGFLAISSFDRRTSPSLRGRWISSNFLCAEPPLPPPDVPKLEDGGVDTAPLAVRQILEQHRESVSCAACHALFDPYGLALEQFDAVGQYRTAYADGTPVDPTAVLPPSESQPEGLAFTGLEGLSSVVTADPRFADCLAQKLLTYGLGRPTTEGDKPFLDEAVLRWRADGQTPSLRGLIRELVLSEAFRSRRGEGR